MNRILGFCFLLGCVLVICCVSPAVAAGTASQDVGQVAPSADPFLALATVTTAIVQAHYCTCAPVFGCSYQPVGFDCAEPPNCCHCAGTDPALRTCVGN
jgi:hypothetical protein